MFGFLLPSLGYIFWTSNIWVPYSNLSVYVPIKHYLGFLFEAYMANIAIHQYVAFILNVIFEHSIQVFGFPHSKP